MSSYAYRLDIRNPSKTGAPVSGLTSVELRNGYAAYVFAEVGNGVYSIASIPAGRYDLYISNVSTGQSYGVGEGELAGLGYSDGTRLKSTASALQWDNTQYSAINHTHSHSSLTGINDGSYKHISSTEKGYLERANNPTGVLILNGEGKVDENNLPIIAKNHKNAGVISDPPTIIRNGNGTVTVGPCVCRLYDNSEYKGTPNDYDIAQATLTPTDREDDWVVADYNAGNPIYRIVDAWSFTAYNVSDIVPIENVLRIGNSLHGEGQGSSGNGAIEKMVLRVGQTERYARVGGVGLVLSSSVTPAVRTVLISGAYVWDDITRVIVHDFSSATDSLYSCVRNAGVWTYTLATQWDNLYYNDNAGLVAMSNNKWGVVWIYRSIGDDKEAWMVRGTSECNTQASANEATPRSDVDKILQSHAQLVGRIVFQKGSDTAYITSAFVGAFGVSAVTDHNNLSGIQGGTVGEYYHDNLAQHNQKVNAGAANGYALLNASAVLPDAVMSATLADNAASTTLPTAGTATAITVLLQSIRDNLKSLFAKLTDGSVTKVGTATVGSTSKGIYLNAGTPTAMSATVGSATQPVYLNSGAVTAITGTIANSTSGNAATATKLATARTISLTGDVSGSASFDGSANATITATVADDSHNHVIANVDGLQEALDGKLSIVKAGTYYNGGSSTGKWMDGISVFIPVAANVSDCARIRVYTVGMGIESQYCTTAVVRIAHRDGVTARSVTLESAVQVNQDMILTRGTESAYYRFVFLTCYIPPYSNLVYEVLSADDPAHLTYPSTLDDALGVGMSYYKAYEVQSATVYAPTYATSYTLPANAPIGKRVCVSNVDNSYGTYIPVYAPSGETMWYEYGGQQADPPHVGYKYAGVWFTKVTSTKWSVS